MYLNSNHQSFAEAPVDGAKIIHNVRGSLRREDASRLYEMAFHANGPVVDFGTNWGLSAYVMGLALADAKQPHRVTTIDLEQKMTDRAKAGLAAQNLTNVEFVTADAVEWSVTTPQTFAAAFVDHSHAYEPVAGVCRNLSRILQPGSVVCFHDYLDRRNEDPDEPDYGVRQAVDENLPAAFSKIDEVGCMGVFRLASN